MILQPINDNIVLKLPVEPKEAVTTGGIVLPGATGHEQPNKGEVIAVGQGRITADGKLIELNVKEGDTVLFNKFAGTLIQEGENEKFLILKESDILAKVK